MIFEESQNTTWTSERLIWCILGLPETTGPSRTSFPHDSESGSLKSNTVPREVGWSIERQVLGTWRVENMIFLIESVVYSNCIYFSPKDMCLRIDFLQRSASEVDSEPSRTCTSTSGGDTKISKFSMKNHDFRGISKRHVDL